jgi:diaminohydroxyphosphoribosylaminopyrimidine deaminase/5-amino-6-(5-phosphoribosylamino)uracil reductase
MVVLKLAITIDGATAAPDGTSVWITGPEARADAHRLRAESDAIVVGAGTVRVDDPALTVREFHPAGDAPTRGLDPLRVVLGRLPSTARAEPALEWTGSLDALLDELGSRGVLQVMVEGGATVAAAFHRAGLVDRYVFYVAPAIMGGTDARGTFAGAGAPTIADIARGRFVSIDRLGDDVRLVVEVPR